MVRHGSGPLASGQAEATQKALEVTQQVAIEARSFRRFVGPGGGRQITMGEGEGGGAHKNRKVIVQVRNVDLPNLPMVCIWRT